MGSENIIYYLFIFNYNTSHIRRQGLVYYINVFGMIKLKQKVQYYSPFNFILFLLLSDRKQHFPGTETKSLPFEIVYLIKRKTFYQENNVRLLD